MHPLAIELRKTARIMTNVVDEKIYIYNIYSEERDQGVVELTRRVGSMESIKKKRKKLGPSVVVSLSFSLSLSRRGLFGVRCNRHRHTFSSSGSGNVPLF